MISVAEALSRLFALVQPLAAETVPLAECGDRVLAETVYAQRTQPPFAASAMDGYAVSGDVSSGDVLTVIGEAAAGHGFDGIVERGQAVRIFTGAPVPHGATRVVIQEDVERSGETITLKDNLDSGSHIRPAGGDFSAGDPLTAPCASQPCPCGVGGGDEHPCPTRAAAPCCGDHGHGRRAVYAGRTPHRRPDHSLE